VAAILILGSFVTAADPTPPPKAEPLQAADAPKPFLRDLETGYLLRYFFMSPRPYCWPNRECLLSGWEVDRSGGRFEFSPNGLAFHSDWFKLVDTSSSAALTLRHQIARQTRGKLTLEFRFKLPARMDGACWQLRDLEKPGVSLASADGKLWCESGGGSPTLLLPIELNRDYGVKVIADLDAKKADVFVDGRPKATAVPWLNPLQTIDYFLVKTGDEATGEMFLNPVNIWKGYAVNETFITCGTGATPSDWKVESASATVEPFECGTKPDIFSLKLVGTGDKPASVVKDFEPVSGKTVWEYRFLLPQRCDGACAMLGSGNKPGPRLIAKGNDILFDDGQEAMLPLVRGYRVNLWYMVKIVADPKTATAAIFVNGKPVAQNAKSASLATAFDRLRFTAPGVMWIDDVQVYPWQDYPADYVPEPKPWPARNGLLLGVQSCNLWREGTAYAGWDYVYPYRDKRKPCLGWYDEGNPEETDWEIKWQVEHGIAFEQHCWYRPNNAVDHPIKDGVLDQGIIKGLFNARYGNLKKFTIMCTNEGACATNLSDLKNNIIPYWIEYFFKDPRYLKIDGKPVLSIYQFGNWMQMFGGQPQGAAAIAMLREEVAKAGFPGIIVMMEDRTNDPNALRAIKALGADCCYSYTWSTQDAKVQRDRMTQARQNGVAAGLNVIPSVSMGWDREAWGVHDGGWLSFADYKSLARWTRDEYMPSLPAESLGRRMILLANWNEFGEGHFMLPTESARFGYLDALRDVFTEGGVHEDNTPTAGQKKRFNVLYPKD
jgi:hypothetical protein